MKRSAVVVGAGVGGLAVGALLARGNWEVTVAESGETTGGRCMSREKDGFVYDFGVHMFSQGEAGPHGEVNRRLGGNLTWVTRQPPARVMGRTEFDFPLDIRPLWRQALLARQLGVRKRSLPAAWRLMRNLMKGEAIAQHDGVTVQEYVSAHTKDPSVHLFINCLCQLYFAQSYSEASAGEFLWCFSRMFQKACFGYPVGGAGEIPRTFEKALLAAGGKVLTGRKVQKILIRGGRALGVKIPGGEILADVVISNAGFNSTIKLCEEKFFPAPYARRAKKLVSSNAYVSVKYALKRRVVPYPVVFHMPNTAPDQVFSYIKEQTAPVEPYIFMPVPSNMDPGLAPPGMQLVIAGTAAPRGASQALCNQILDAVHRRVCQLFPDLPGALIWERRTLRGDVTSLTGHRAGEAIGLGQGPGQTGAGRPEHQTPIPGLYLVGADAGARGIGTEMASQSALNLADKLT